MKFSDFLTEQRVELFDPVQVKIDPDSDGPYDVARHLLPIVVQMAYTNLYHKKRQHEKKHGPRSDEPDAFNFEFTRKALEDEIDQLLHHLGETLTDLRQAEIMASVKSVEKKFKEPLEE